MYGNKAPPKGQEHRRYIIVDGRATAIVVNGWAGTRLLVVSVYLDVEDKLGTFNTNILYEIGAWITRAGLPYVICGDFNNSVESISKLNWLSATDGMVVAPSTPTYTSTTQKEGSIIDFFIVKRWMTPYATAVTAIRKATRHSPVLLTLKRRIGKLYDYTISKPTAFPQDMTKGACNNNTNQPNWSYRTFMNKAKASTDGYTIEKHAAYIMLGIDDELVNKFGVSHDDQRVGSTIESPYRGRADAPTIKRTKVLPSAKVNGPAVDTATENNDHMVQEVTTAIRNFSSRLYQDGKFHHADGRVLYVGPYDKIKNTATHNRNICDAARKTYKGRHKAALENARNIMEDIRLW